MVAGDALTGQAHPGELLELLWDQQDDTDVHMA